LPYAQRRFRNHGIKHWDRHIFSLPSVEGWIYVHGLRAPALFDRNLPKPKEKEVIVLLEKEGKKKAKDHDENPQAKATIPPPEEKPLNIILPYGLSPRRIESVTGDTRDEVLNARDFPKDLFRIFPSWVRLQYTGTYHGDKALLVSAHNDRATVYVIPRLPTTLVELSSKPSYPARRFHPDIFRQGFSGLVDFDISVDTKKVVMQFSTTDKQLQRTKNSRLLLGQPFEFYNGLLRLEVDKSACTSTWPSYDEFMTFGVFSFRDVFPDQSPERRIFNRISFIPWFQYQNIRVSNRVRFVDINSADSAVVVRVQDDLVYIRPSNDLTGRTIPVPFENLRLDFHVGEVVEIPPQESTWLPVGSKPLPAICAIDGHSFPPSLSRIPGLIVEVGEYTLNVLVGNATQVISKLHTFEHYTNILQYTVHQRICHQNPIGGDISAATVKIVSTLLPKHKKLLDGSM
jgi:hypothetical protein